MKKGTTQYQMQSSVALRLLQWWLGSNRGTGFPTPPQPAASQQPVLPAWSGFIAEHTVVIAGGQGSAHPKPQDTGLGT